MPDEKSITIFNETEKGITETVTIPMAEYRRLVRAETLLHTILEGDEYDRKAIAGAAINFFADWEGKL